jgi:hypothetical protein
MWQSHLFNSCLAFLQYPALVKRAGQSRGYAAAIKGFGLLERVRHPMSHRDTAVGVHASNTTERSKQNAGRRKLMGGTHFLYPTSHKECGRYQPKQLK